MARPSEGRTKYLRVRLTEAEYARLQSDADRAAVSVSDIARAQLLNANIPKRKPRKSADHTILTMVLHHLGKVGGLLNQIAKVANSTGDLTGFRDARLLKNLLEEIRDMVRAALTP
jgi:hypothetical protein